MALEPVTSKNVVRAVKELRWLVAALLGKSGLDGDGVQRAFELAETETRKLDEAMMAAAFEHFQETPEGQEARRIAEEEWKKRQDAAWREWCIEDGKITRHP
jgi:hypothetical protein